MLEKEQQFPKPKNEETTENSKGSAVENQTEKLEQTDGITENELELSKELEKFIEAKAEYVYEKNIAVRFTNAAYLDDIFVTKKEFRGNVSLFMQKDQDYKKYYDQGNRNYLDLPDGKATLGILIDRVYENFRIKGQRINLEKDPEKYKNHFWDLFMEDHTDWVGTGSGERDYEVKNIKKIKQESSGQSDFATKMREHAIKKLNLKPDDLPKEIISQEILQNKNYFKKVGNLRKYLHHTSMLDLYGKNSKRFEKELKSGQDIFRNYNIGILTTTKTTKSYGNFGRKSWGEFKNTQEIDIKDDLKGIICTIRDRVFEQKVIKEMIRLTRDNPRTRVPVFDLDGNQIYPTRRKRKEIEELID